ncbi:MAG: NAD(P)/FAD-dependent oxidoreductase [bacterium]
MEKEYDVVIIGGGINGLACGCYLVKAGLKALIIERRHETGGGLVTEDFAGFRYNLHATYHLMADVMPPVADFDLERHGVLPIFPDAQVALPCSDGRALVLYRDLDRTVEGISSFSPEDADNFKNMYLEFKELCDEILIPATYAPPIPPVEYMVMLNQSELGKRLAHVSELSPLEILDEYKLKDPTLRAALLFLSTMWGIPHDTGGLGYMVPLYIYRMTNMALIRGGSHRLSSALARIFIMSGGDILDGEEATGIPIEGGHAAKVVTAAGMEFSAKAIVSTLNPEQTFMQMASGADLPIELSHQVKNWKFEHSSLFGAHLSLLKAPDYKAADSNPDVNRAMMQIIGYETEEVLIEHLKQLKENKLPPAAGHATVATLFDASQAPEGCHTGRWECFAPYYEDWDDRKDEYAAQGIKKWEEYTKEPLNPVRVYSYSPLDIERKLTTMKRGSIKHGEYNPLQMGYLRPNDLCSGVKTPIPGLYVCGASVYPGGMILGGPGYIAAGVLADELGAKRWWKEPEYVTRARGKNFIR